MPLDELAEELGLTTTEIVMLCEQIGASTARRASTLSQAQADLVRHYASLDGLRRDQPPTGPPLQVGEPSPDQGGVDFIPSRSRRSLSVLHLQTIWNPVGGREVLAAREVLTHLISEGHQTRVRTVIGDGSNVAVEYRDDFLSVQDFRSSPPDVILCEHSLLGPDPGQMRVPLEELKWFLNRGGVVIVDNYFPNDDFDRDAEFQGLSPLLALNPLDREPPSARGSRLRSYHVLGAESPQVVTCRAADNGAAPWLQPAYDNLEAVQILDVRPVWATQDPVGKIAKSDADLVSSRDAFDVERGPYAWGVVKQVGSGYLVAIAGSVMFDGVVSKNPDNALFVQKLIELLVGEVTREQGLRGGVSTSTLTSPDAARLLDLIKKGENLHVEFKSSARHDLRTGERNTELEDEIAKQVVGFWNSDGGELLVGVSDDGQIIGIEHDFAHCGKSANQDGWTRFIEDLLLDRIPAITAPSVRVLTVSGRAIGWISVSRGPREAFFRARKNASGNREEQFYYRLNNSRRELKGAQLATYIRDRFDTQ